MNDIEKAKSELNELKRKIENGDFLGLAVCVVISIISVIAGLLSGDAFYIGLLISIPFIGLSIYFYHISETHKTEAQKLQTLIDKEIRIKTEQEKQVKDAKMNELVQIALKYETEWGMPDDALSVGVFDYDEDFLRICIINSPKTWYQNAVPCVCWTDGTSFFIIHDKTKITGNERDIIHIKISLLNIHYYFLKGEMIRSERTVIEGRLSYTGASVNGIGFGEIKRTPSLTLPDITDTRYIQFYYKEDRANNLRKLLFDADSLDSLIRVIPQFEKSV